MSIYVFSLLVGYELSGVDVALARRNNYFRKANAQAKYIFTDLPAPTYIDRYRNQGLQPEEMMCVQLKLSNANDLSGNYSVTQKISELKATMGFDNQLTKEKEIVLYKNGLRIAVLLLKDDPQYLSSILFYESERLIAEEFYTDRLLYIKHYITASSNGMLYAKLKRISFLDEKGKTTCESLYENNIPTYVFPNGECLTKYDLIEKFIIELNLCKDDLVFVDRPTYLDFIQPLLQHKNNAKLITFLHSGHYYKRRESPDALFMNCEYYEWFKHSNYIDVVVVSTEEQKEDLIDKYKMYGCHIPRIEVIPVSGLSELRYPTEGRTPYSLITVSRIDDRKNLPWVIKSVAAAHEILPSITLDIYGGGHPNHISNLNNLVTELGAESFIHLKGQADVREIYKSYEIFITASLWETLGLSCMEAVGSGNALIGLDVRYGNRLFIKTGTNGHLVDFSIDDMSKEGIEAATIEKMKAAIVDVLSDHERLQQYHDNSYQIAKDFMDELIEEKWVAFLKEFY